MQHYLHGHVVEVKASAVFTSFILGNVCCVVVSVFVSHFSIAMPVKRYTNHT